MLLIDGKTFIELLSSGTSSDKPRNSKKLLEIEIVKYLPAKLRKDENQSET